MGGRVGFDANGGRRKRGKSNGRQRQGVEWIREGIPEQVVG